MRAFRIRDQKILRTAVFFAFVGVASSCGQPPYADRAQVDAPITAVPADLPGADSDLTTIKPKPSSPRGLGMPDPITGTYLTPRARKNRRLKKQMWNPEWDTVIMNAIPPRMLSKEVPADVKVACPRFFELTTDQMKTFWAYFLQSVAVPESDFLLTDKYNEIGIKAPDRVTGKPNVSEGLLQLSYQDTKLHGCAFDWKADQARKPGELATIHDPVLNLECGVKILNKQLFGPGRVPPRTLFPAKDYYWSVLTRGEPGLEQVMKQLAGVPRFCR